MAKFIVSVMEISCGSVEVEADSTDEVRDKAEEEYYEGNVCWTSSEFSTQEVTEQN